MNEEDKFDRLIFWPTMKCEYISIDFTLSKL